MKLAIDTSLMRRLSLDDALGSAYGLGYRNVEVGLAHYNPDEATDEETRELKDSLTSHSMNLAALFGTYPVAYPDEEIRRRGVEQLRRAMGRAKELGCNLVVSEMMGESERYPEFAAAFSKSMGELIPVLEGQGTTLCFEAHPGDFTERNKFAVDLIRGLGSTRVRYLYCVPHSFILGESVGEMIEYAGGVLGYVHLADSLRPEKTFFSGRYFPQVQPHQHLTIGKGDVDVRSVFASLRKIGYDGFLTVDPFSMFDSPLDAARESKELAEKLMGASP